MTPLQQRFKEAIDEFDSSFKNSTELAKDCEKIAEEFATEFAEWLDADGYHQAKVGGIWKNSMDAKIPQEKEFTTQELIQQFK